ncbi:multidrug transporter [Halosolutus gelatinilyticus]|uniref:multidrug transporter n=1 Tax=Halosolutus gelatinilyticus TaxID=2931975 RepID=UPI001FF46DC8|nr:multidrug transporter [Halosolutus gelatinilyticus]
MSFSFGRNSSSIVTAIGVAVALVAVVGTQVFGWEWGSGQLVPTIIGAVVAAIAVIVAASRLA